jgi:type I restriction enzyme, S subunit
MIALTDSIRPLGEVAKVISGYAFKSAEFKGEGIPVIKIKNIRVGTVDLDDAAYVDERFLNLDFKYHVNPGDLLISLTGSHPNQPNSVVGRVARMGRHHTRCLLNQRAGKIYLRKGASGDLGYLYYVLSSPGFRNAVAMLANGAASQANVSPTQVESLEIPLPGLPTQRKIAGILSAYDDLIENNLRRIKILEEMAQSLYREWFVHFRFPGREAAQFIDSELGQIPQGWEVKKLKEVCVLTMGQSPKSEFYNDRGEGTPFHQGVTNFGDYFPTDRLFSTEENRFAEDGDVLFSVRAPVGRINVANKRIVIGRGVSAIRERNGHQDFLLFQLKHLFQKEDSMGNGAIFKAVTKSDMEDIKLLVPDRSWIERFEKAASPIFSNLKNVTQRNQTLRRTRDLLLPKLLGAAIHNKEIA